MRFIPKLIDYLSTSTKEQGPLIPWYSSTYLNSASLANFDNLGTLWWIKGPTADGGGNAFMCVKASAALAAGQLVAATAGTTGTVTAAGSTVAKIITNITTTSVNDEVDNWIFFENGASLRRIKGNTAGANATFTVSIPDLNIATAPNDPDKLSAVPANGSAITVFRDYSVRVCTGSLVPLGVAMGTVTAGNYTLIQVAGLAQILTVGSGTATVFGVPGAPSTAGVAIGSAGANQYLQGGSLVAMHAFAGSSQLCPWMINFTGS